MTYTIQRADERGSADHGWLHSRFSFSFADYHNPEQMGFGALRVINDDTIAPQSGFGMHPHRDMEIITIVTEGTVEHRDSMGHHGSTSAWEVQCMRAGSGILHSEFNPSKTQTLRLFQIWIRPREKGLPPSYSQHRFSPEVFEGRFATVASGLEQPAVLCIMQDAHLERGRFKAGSGVTVTPRAEGLYVFVIAGSITLAGETLDARDAMALTHPETLTLGITAASDVLLFHLPL